jgi:hypothetical protein
MTMAVMARGINSGQTSIGEISAEIEPFPSRDSDISIQTVGLPIIIAGLSQKGGLVKKSGRCGSTLELASIRIDESMPGISIGERRAARDNRFTNANQERLAMTYNCRILHKKRVGSGSQIRHKHLPESNFFTLGRIVPIPLSSTSTYRCHLLSNFRRKDRT